MEFINVENIFLKIYWYGEYLIKYSDKYRMFLKDG